MAIEQDVLDEIRILRERLPHVRGVIVASTDGFLVAASTHDVEPESMAAMAAAHLGLGRQIARAVAFGDFEETVTRAAAGYVAIFAAGTDALLTVLAGPQLNVGRLHHEARPVAARIGKLVADGNPR